MKNVFIAVIALAVHGPLAAAQPAVANTNPADPAAPVPVLEYESAFKGYRSFRETPLAPWRDVNDEVARVGGHLGIVRGQSGGTERAAPGKIMKKGDAPRHPASR